MIKRISRVQIQANAPVQRELELRGIKSALQGRIPISVNLRAGNRELACFHCPITPLCNQ